MRLLNVISLARRYHNSKTHSHHVACLTTSLFDQTTTLHKVVEQEKEWLESAAILHDVGYVINPRQHPMVAYFLCHRRVILPYPNVASESPATTIQETRPQRVVFPQNRLNKPRPFLATCPGQVAHRSSPQP